MIRPAQPADIERVVEIYNQAIDARFQTAFTTRQSVAERAEWFSGHLQPEYPLFVYVLDGIVAGWFSISPYRSGRAALRYAVEISYFVDTAYLHRGIGTQLLQQGIKACRELGYRVAIAIILDKNVPSMKIMEKFGFERWAFLPDVADFDGVRCGHVYYGIKL